MTSTSTPPASTAATTTTVFVRNIPYSWRDSSLERAFEHIGPIKRAFVVTARGTKKAQTLGADGAINTTGAEKFENRGFGFIEFATNSDARRATEEMNGKEVEDTSAQATAASSTSAPAKKKGPQKLAVELSVPKGEKPAIGAKKDAETPAASTSTEPVAISTQKHSAPVAAAATTPAAPAKKESKKGEKVKDVKLDEKTLENLKEKSKPQKVASDSETDESDDEDMEEKKSEVKVESKKSSNASAHQPTRPSTPSASSSTTDSTATPTPTATNSRTVLLSGINVTVKNLNEHIKGIVPNISHIFFPSPESTLKYKAARLTFESDTLADAAAKLLDKKLIKGDPIRAIRLQHEEKLTRLIIRNLPWLVGEKRLHLIFRDCCKPVEQGGGGGKIVSIDLPKEADGKSKGFGFISFTTLQAAELALKKTGTILNNRPIAVDWSLSKDDYENRVKLNEIESKKAEEKAAEKAKKLAEAEEKKKKEEKKANKLKTEANDVKVKKETVDADGDVDMLDLQADRRKNKDILSSILGDEDNAANEEEEAEERKELIKKELKAAVGNDLKKKVKKESDDDMSDVEEVEKGGYEDEDESMDSDEEDSEEEDDSEHEDDNLNVSGDESDSDSADDSDSDDDEAAPELDQTTTPKFTHPRTSDTVKGCTIFIRNLSYDTNEAKLTEKFKQFGQINYAKVCWDKELDRSRGTGFVQFKDPEVAKKVVGMSVDTSTNPAVLYKKNRITAAVASGQGITLDGRVLNIALAVDREQATTLAEKNREKQKEDKRNLYLANEGNIRADSEAAKDMPPAELEKREKAFREKKKKLKNPNYCVSRTRLSVRNLPLDADEKLLKRVFLKAARDAVKEQPRDSPLRDGTIGQPVIQQVKLLRATDRFDSKGEGKSKRYGFVEFDKHEHSLLALRALNNNPNAFASAAELKSGKHSRPFVEFALEDARKLLIRNQKMAAQLKRKELRERQQKELDEKEGKVTDAKKSAKPQIKSSEQPRKKPTKPVADPSAGGGRGACFTCGEGGHVSKNCPKLSAGKPTDASPAVGSKRKATDSEEKSSDEPAQKKSKADNNGKSTTSITTTSSTPAPAAPTASTKKNKNNRHKDVALPKHLGGGGDAEDEQFDKLVQQHKKKFFGGDGPAEKEKLKAAASRWFD